MRNLGKFMSSLYRHIIDIIIIFIIIIPIIYDICILVYFINIYYYKTERPQDPIKQYVKKKTEYFQKI